MKFSPPDPEIQVADLETQILDPEIQTPILKLMPSILDLEIRPGCWDSGHPDPEIQSPNLKLGTPNKIWIRA